jgi:GrpB-like predicted nucleotidyltransferase (UPF0157 family)/quercetin dioxygenase-like cupin family protein
VRIVRFDEEVSIRVTDGGSRFGIGPLTGPGSRVRVQVVHLPPGGSVARHVTPGQQLFAVVAGSGWVAGHDGRRRDIAAGHGALWEAGEEHEAHSDAGLTATCIEGSFDVWAVVVTTDIVVADHDPAWRGWFETVRDHVWPAVEGLALRIDHVGSTAVPGLAAKPVVDMDIVVAAPADVRPAIRRLAAIGYRWRGDLGVVGREAFAPPPDADLPPHHLYLVVEGSPAHLDHVVLRDLLRGDAGARDRYAALKRRNAALAAGDMDVYVDAKAGLVRELLARARAERGLPAEQDGP